MAKPAPGPRPEDMPSVSAHLWFNGNSRAALELYARIFGAEPSGPVVASPDGQTILHALVRIGGTPVMLADGWPRGWEQGPRSGTTVSLWVYVEDCDATFERAVAAGCEVMMPLADAFWGDRFGKIKDPFGHVWSIATWKWRLEPEEIEQRKAAWLKSV